MNRPQQLLAPLLLCLSAVAMGQDAEPLVRTDEAETGFIDAEGRPLSVVNDAYGQLISGIDAAGLETTIQRNAGGNPILVTQPNGASELNTFDGRGNRLSTTDQTLGGTISMEYEQEFNQITMVTDPFGSQTLFEIDSAGNTMRIATSEGRELTATYRSDGLLSTTTDTLGTVAAVTYDTDVMPTELTVGTGTSARTARRTYTPEGFVDTEIDALGRIYDMDYDMLGRVTRVTLPDARAVTYEFDEAGNTSQVTPPGRESYNFDYSDVGLLLSESYPTVTGGGTNDMTYSYNEARQLTEVTRADGVTYTFSYDGAGRTETISQPDGNYVYRYSATTGQLDGLDSPDGVTQSFSYHNNLLTEVNWSGAITGAVGYSYDAKGRVNTLSIAGQDFVYAYSPDDDLIQAGQQTLAHDPSSGLLMSTSLDTIDEAFSYNQFAELTGHSVSSAATTIYDAQYIRDSLGRVTQIIETIEGTTLTIDYGYDLAGRLETVTEDDVLIATYSYDSNDNRIDNGGVYDAQDRVSSRTGATYSYNAQGERVQKTAGASVTGYQYDAQGTLMGVTLPDATQIDYLQDGQSRRVVKQIDGSTVEAWIYVDSLQPAARLNASNTATQRYIYADRSIVPAYIDDGAQRFKVISNHLGSVRLVVDASDGTVIQRIDYDAWGTVTNDTNPNFQPFAYAGGLYDGDTGLAHFGLREYDAETGHWTSKDPIGFDGSPNNLYSYVEADPINQIDPTGMESNPSPRGEKAGVVLSINGRGAWITRANEPNIQYILREGDAVCVGDIIESEEATQVAVEFLIGGQAIIKRGTQVEFTDTREAKTVGNPFLVRAATIWAKVDKQDAEFKIKSDSTGSMGRGDG